MGFTGNGALLQAEAVKEGHRTVDEFKRVAVSWTSEHQKLASSCASTLAAHVDQIQKEMSSEVMLRGQGTVC